MSEIFDDTLCTLGEGPLWHPEREQLFWFDIIGKRLFAKGDGAPRSWDFDEHVSAAGWIDRDSLLIASETALFRFHLVSGSRRDLVALEAESAATRSNDGRADPQGGFWIGTMGKAAEPGLGAIYRYFRGELRRLFAPITIPNAICFTPDGRQACFADTDIGKIWRVALDAEGWPSGEPELFLDLAAKGLNPDGAVFDAAGNLWLAEWGAGRVAVHGPDGRFLRAVEFDAPQTSCPAFGGPELSMLYCTSARQGMAAEALAAHPKSGMTFMAATDARGQRAHRVVL
jgi:sugar lactone lactonase YvrE